MIYFEKDLEGYPEWVLPYLKVVPIFYTEDYYLEEFTSDDFNKNYYYSAFDYVFEKVDDNHYKLKGYVESWLRATGYYAVPMYVDVKLYITNKRAFYEIQTKKE